MIFHGTFFIPKILEPELLYLIINNQRDATLSSLIYYLLRDYSTCFGCSLHPSSGIHKNVVTTNGTGHASEWCGLKSIKSCQDRVSTSQCHGQNSPNLAMT